MRNARLRRIQADQRAFYDISSKGCVEALQAIIDPLYVYRGSREWDPDEIGHFDPTALAFPIKNASDAHYIADMFTIHLPRLIFLSSRNQSSDGRSSPLCDLSSYQTAEELEAALALAYYLPNAYVHFATDEVSNIFR